MENTIQGIIKQWHSENISLNNGVSPEFIIEVEKSIGFTFPDDFKELYLQANGFSNFDWRKNMFSIWPLEKILEEYNISEDKDFVGFTDYMIFSHTIGFVKGKIEVFKSYGANNPIPIADSFISALNLINANSDLIY